MGEVFIYEFSDRGSTPLISIMSFLDLNVGRVATNITSALWVMQLMIFKRTQLIKTGGILHGNYSDSSV